MDSSCIWLWQPHVWGCPESIHSPQVPNLGSVLELVSWQRSPKGQIFLFSVPGQTGLGMCPKPCRQMEEEVRLLPPQRLPLARWFLQWGWSSWACFYCPELPLFPSASKPGSTTLLKIFCAPNLLPTDFFHLTLARVIFLLPPSKDPSM